MNGLPGINNTPTTTTQYVDLLVSDFNGINDLNELNIEVVNKVQRARLDKKSVRFIVTSSDLIRNSLDRTDISSYRILNRVFLELSNQVIIKHDIGITCYKNRHAESIFIEDGFMDITLSQFSSLDPLFYDEYMTKLNHKSRVDNQLVRLNLTISKDRYSQVTPPLISELTDSELAEFRNKVPHRSISTRSDIIIVIDREGKSATIKDRRSTGHQVIRH